jgi:hypothetical protein
MMALLGAWQKEPQPARREGVFNSFYPADLNQGQTTHRLFFSQVLYFFFLSAHWR